MKPVCEKHSFESQGVRCAARLYRPAEVEHPPVVVMAHGFGGEMTWRLPAYAERFAERGIATFLFDYRTFGDSAGRPRQVIDPFGQRADWLAAIDYVRTVSTVDADRLGLWGTSFSGGHVIETAARVDDVTAVVAQVPFVDGLRTVVQLLRSGGLEYLKEGLTAAVRDLGRILTRRDPYYVPVTGSPDEFALLNTPGAMQGIEALIPDGETWENRCAARIILTIVLYRPLSRASDVDAPVFVAEAENDRLLPASLTNRLVEELADVERVRYPIGHFDGYLGAPFETIVDREGEFLSRHLNA